MQRSEGTTGTRDGERQRVEAAAETLAMIGSRGESVAEVAHDARNMVTALGLYCDLLEEPGVLAGPFAHYGGELRLVAAASRRLVEKLAALGATRETNPFAGSISSPAANLASSLRAVTPAGETAGQPRPLNAPVYSHLHHKRPDSSRWELMPVAPIENMAAELLANHNLLAALAGPMNVMTVDVVGGAAAVRLTGEDLTRVLVNMIKNSAEAMPAGGRIQIELHELRAGAGTVETLALTVEDSGPGIPEQALESVFTSGYTTRAKGTEAPGGWPVIHRGLGLAISRSIVEAAGGRITASNRPHGGARFAIELPVRHS